MSTIAQNYSTSEKAKNSSRFATWITRFPLVAVMILFTLIGAKFGFTPVHSAGARGILFSSGEGITTGRVGLGAFPLAFAIITLTCLVSRKRVLIGLYNILILIGTLLAFRIFGMFADNSVKENMRVLAPEIVLLVLSFIALSVERRRRRSESDIEAF